MTKHYTNFYETTKEANMRLRGTVVLYDGLPYYVLGISDHKNDKIFRIYLDSFPDLTFYRDANAPPLHSNEECNSWAKKMDTYLETQTTGCTILRKMMNSPAFNKFRPFPLGMANVEGAALYVQRHPTRKSEQGLSEGMLINQTFSLSMQKNYAVGLLSKDFYNCIVGKYPSYEETVTNLKNPECANLSAAFHREFCLVKAPLGVLYLGYRTDLIGFVHPDNNYKLTLSKKFSYCREVVESLNLFTTILIP